MSKYEIKIGEAELRTDDAEMAKMFIERFTGRLAPTVPYWPTATTEPCTPLWPAGNTWYKTTC